MRRHILLALAAASLSACYWKTGRGAEDQRIAARGAIASLEVGSAAAGSPIIGEIMEARDTAFVLLANQQIVIVPYGALLRARIAGAPFYSLWEIQRSREVLAELQRMSRFPLGITPEIMTKLLETTGQRAPLMVTQ